MNILTNLKNVLLSPRFVSFYWVVGITAAIDFLHLLTTAIPDIGIPQWAAVLAVGAISQITKALNNYKQGKEMGFARK